MVNSMDFIVFAVSATIGTFLLVIGILLTIFGWINLKHIHAVTGMIVGWFVMLTAWAFYSFAITLLIRMITGINIIPT